MKHIKILLSVCVGIFEIKMNCMNIHASDKLCDFGFFFVHAHRSSSAVILLFLHITHIIIIIVSVADTIRFPMTLYSDEESDSNNNLA